MNILHTVQYYSPSVGGAQEVVKQISEHLVRRGHHVTVATTRLPDRSSCQINGVQVVEFNVAGNAVDGFHGEADRYQRFLIEGQFDIMMNYAAQQWATDLAFPILEQIRYPKIMIPCGFSGLYDQHYHDYFRQMPNRMRNYDHLVFHANNYRDINFARQSGIEKYSVIPNGASSEEFSQADSTFRRKFHIPDNVPLLLTVGSHTGNKGHRLCLEAFDRLRVGHAVLVIIGNFDGSRLLGRLAVSGILGLAKRLKVGLRVRTKILELSGSSGLGCLPDCQSRARLIGLRSWGRKRVLLLDSPREDVVAAYRAADLFIFGSNIEYSPLVLFEAMASQTPFISLACGNVMEIVDWSGGGIIAPTIQQDGGLVDGNPEDFAHTIESLLGDPVQRAILAESGHRAWLERYTWDKIVDQYEALYKKLSQES